MSAPYELRIIESCVTCKLREDQLFCDLHADALAELDRLRFTTSYLAGSVLFREGEAPQTVLVLCQGKVKLSVASQDGKTVILNIAEPGQVLGMSSAISGHPHETITLRETLHFDLVPRFPRSHFFGVWGDTTGESHET